MLIKVVLVAVGIILILLGSVLLALRNVKWESRLTKLSKSKKKLMLVAGVVLVILSQSFAFVPTNRTGISILFEQINDVPSRSGFRLKIPFFERIKLVDNRQQSKTMEDKCYSETKQQTVIYYENVKITYQISSADSAIWIYSNVQNYKDELIGIDMMASAVKASSVKLSDKEATNRALIEPEITANLQKLCDEKYGVEIVNVISTVVGNADFTDEYNNAISAKNIAEMEEQTQQINNRVAEQKAESEKRVAITNAEAEAEVKAKNAEAEANALYIIAEKQAEANKLLNNSLTENLLKQQMYEKWNGQLPKYSGSGESSFIFDETGETAETAVAE